MVKLICSSLYNFSDDAFSNIGNNVLKLNMWSGTSNTYMIQYILQIKSNNYCLEEFSRYHLKSLVLISQAHDITCAQTTARRYYLCLGDSMIKTLTMLLGEFEFFSLLENPDNNGNSQRAPGERLSKGEYFGGLTLNLESLQR